MTWLLEFSYGEIYGREAPGLTLADRELAAIASLSSSSLQQLRCVPRNAFAKGLCVCKVWLDAEQLHYLQMDKTTSGWAVGEE